MSMGLDQREHPNKNLRFRAIAGSSAPAAATLLSKLMQAEIIENTVSIMDFESRNLLILLFEQEPDSGSHKSSYL